MSRAPHVLSAMELASSSGSTRAATIRSPRRLPAGDRRSALFSAVAIRPNLIELQLSRKARIALPIRGDLVYPTEARHDDLEGSGNEAT